MLATVIEMLGHLTLELAIVSVIDLTNENSSSDDEEH